MMIQFPGTSKAGLGLLLLAVSAFTFAQDERPALVKVTEASMQNIAPITLVPGTVVSRKDARLSAEVQGRLISVADVGTVVLAGEIVAEIEDTRLRLRQTELQAEVSRAEARLRFLESEDKRFTQLAESNLAAQAQLEQTQSDRDVAVGDLEIARSRLAQNADQVFRTRIMAPFGGVVVERLMTPGEWVSEGSEVVRLVDQQSLEVIARAPLEYYSFVQPGQLLELRAGKQTTVGEVRTVVAVGDEQTHQFELRLDLDASLFPVGRTLRVSIPTANSRKVLTVPRDALVLRPEGHSVFIVDANNQAQQIRVTIGVGQGEQIEVQGAVSPGDRVIIRGNERLRPGQTVNIAES